MAPTITLSLQLYRCDLETHNSGAFQPHSLSYKQQQQNVRISSTYTNSIFNNGLPIVATAVILHRLRNQISEHILNMHQLKVYVIYVPQEIRDGVFNMETL